jgi:hypothetical protein
MNTWDTDWQGAHKAPSISPTLRHRAHGCSGVWQEALSLSWELCLKTASLFHSKTFRSFVFLANIRDVGLQARLVRVDLPDLSVVRGLTSIWIPSLRYIPTLCHVITTQMAKCTVAGAIRPARI